MVLSLVGCSRSEFAHQHDRALLQNPNGVELKIRTRDGRTHFAVSEPVQYEEIYTSKYVGLWHIEVFDGWNQAANSEVVHITDGKRIWGQPWMYAIVCCDSRHVWLSPEPVRLPYKMFADRARVNPEGWRNPDWYTLRLPNNPGTYQLYITTERVFGPSDSTTTYHGVGVPVSSNVLKLKVK